MTRLSTHLPLATWRVVVFACGVTLLAAGFVKFGDIETFARVLEKQAVVGIEYIQTTAVAIALVESFIGVAVVATILRPGAKHILRGSLAAGGLFLIFTAYAFILTIQPPPEPVSCGCLLSKQPIADWTPLLIRNAVITILLFLVPLLLRPLAREHAPAGER